MPRAQAIALIVVALVLGFVVGFKSGKGSMAAQTGATCPTVPPTASVTAPTPPAAAPEASPTAAAALPRLVDLGSTTCIPCKEMAPILDELKTELKGKVEVEFINVTQPWMRHLTASKEPLGAFKSDMVHANARGSQLIGRFLELYFAPDGWDARAVAKKALTQAAPPAK